MAKAGGDGGAAAEADLTPSNYVSLANGRFDDTDRDDLRRAFDDVVASDRRLVVHFHGGLVSKRSGMKIASRLLPVYREVDAHPLFIVWQAGLHEVVGHNLAKIAEERIFKRLVGRLLQFAIGKGRELPGARGDLDLPPLAPTMARAAERGDPFAEEPKPSRTLTAEQLQQAKIQLEDDTVLEDELAKIANSLHTPQPSQVDSRSIGATASTKTLMSPAALAEIAMPSVTGDRGIISTALLVKATLTALKRVIDRLADGRDHGIYPTAVEEVLREFYLANAGGLVWREMKQDTADAFGNDSRQGGTALLEEIARLDDERNPVLVGHSTGAVYICNLLAHTAALPPKRRFDIVFLAPACDFDLLARTLDDHADRIGRVRVFSMQDEFEQRDQLVPILYPRSLLYFISGVLEKEADAPIAGMQRFHLADGPFPAGRSAAVDRVREYVGSPGRAVWSVVSEDGGLASGSRSHGDFDNDLATLASVQEYVRG